MPAPSRGHQSEIEGSDPGKPLSPVMEIFYNLGRVARVNLRQAELFFPPERIVHLVHGQLPVGVAM